MLRIAALMGLAAPLVLTSLVIAAPNPKASADLGKDARLTKKVTLPGDMLRLQQVVETLGEATEVDLMVQGDLLRRPVTLRVKNKTAAELLENLATLFGGTWLRKGDGYLLITDQVTAKLVAAYPSNASTDREEQALFRSVTPGQLAKLRRGGAVQYEELTPVQKRLVLAIARDRFLKKPDQYPSSVLVGTGIELYRTIVLTPGPKGRAVLTFPVEQDPNLKNPSTVELGVPAITDTGGLMRVSLATAPAAW